MSFKFRCQNTFIMFLFSMRDARTSSESPFPYVSFQRCVSYTLVGQAGIEPAALRLLSVALPTELLSHKAGFSPARIPGAVVAHIRHGPSMNWRISRHSSRAAGGIGRIQTGGLVIPNHALCQLSYYSVLSAPGEWCAALPAPAAFFAQCP